jgi:putative nucleotidyltransferase with HDIG domain
MTEAIRFLTSFTQALATMTLYEEGHPARDRVADAAYGALRDLQASQGTILFTFLGEDVVCGRIPIRELRSWEWANRLSAAGIQRLEFEDEVSKEDFDAFLDEVLARLASVAGRSSESRQMRSTGIRFGEVGVRGEVVSSEIPLAFTSFSLSAEADAVRWLHEQVKDMRQLHLIEAEGVVRTLSVAMHSDQKMIIPLLQLRRYDEYTTTHSMNVSVLAMAFAEFLGLGPRDVRTFGVAGLLHDIGKVKIPLEILTKPGRLTDEERAIINRHPVDGAKIILETQRHLDLAAVVAYEHHIMIDGGGYPAVRYRRDCHYASRLIHICDVYDALRTRRPYRDAWPAERVTGYIGERAGIEFDGEMAAAFVRMMHLWEERVMPVHEDEEIRVGGRSQAPPSEESETTHVV